MSKATISVVISTYNAAETLAACIESYIKQTYPLKELIIVDGASKDDSLNIIRSYGEHVTHFISEPDTGIYNAWNKALKLTSGQWLFFLGADDYFKSHDVLEQAASYLDLIPEELNVAYGSVDYINNKGDLLYTRGDPWEIVGKRYRQLMTIPHQGVFHRNTLFKIHGQFDESFRIAGDYEILLRELKDKPAIFIPLTISAMRQAGVSNQSSNSMLIMQEIRKAQRKNGLNNPGIYWYLALVRVYIRLFIWKVLGEKTTRRLLDIGRGVMGKPAHWTKNI